MESKQFFGFGFLGLATVAALNHVGPKKTSDTITRKSNPKKSKIKTKGNPAHFRDDEYVVLTHFERDNSYVELRNETTGETVIAWFDSEVEEAVEDGFLNPKNWKKSVLQYARDHKLIWDEDRPLPRRKNPTPSKKIRINERQKAWLADEYAVCVYKMKPVDFLLLTCETRQELERVLQDAESLDFYNSDEVNGDMHVHPFLAIRAKDGKIFQHEGRHRAAALLNSGSKELYEVAIILLNERNHNLEYEATLTMMPRQIRGQRGSAEIHTVDKTRIVPLIESKSNPKKKRVMRSKNPTHTITKKEMPLVLAALSYLKTDSSSLDELSQRTQDILLREGLYDFTKMELTRKGHEVLDREGQMYLPNLGDED